MEVRSVSGNGMRRLSPLVTASGTSPNSWKKVPSPAWPWLLRLPPPLVGQRVHPVLSAWLKERRKAEEEVGRVYELAAPGLPPLQSDLRKWPEAPVTTVTHLDDLADSAAWFLWTPFALQQGAALPTLVAAARRVVASGGTWAAYELLPEAMPGHWLYRAFPEAGVNARQQTWDAARLYSSLTQAGWEVALTWHTYYQPVTLGVALALAQQRERWPVLAELPDAVYANRLERLATLVDQQGREHLLGSQVAVLEFRARRG